MNRIATHQKTKRKPFLKWQTGAYDRYAQLQLVLPQQLLLLCRILDTTPEELVKNFTYDLSCGSWNREGRDQAKQHLVSYFLALGYGQHLYTPEEISRIFSEMDALGMLFPQNGDEKVIKRYTSWRNAHYKYWFKKWYRLPRRPRPKSNNR